MPIKLYLIKILYYFLYILVFFFLVTVCISIIFYASGYRLNTKAMKVQKTGLLIIDCKETDLQIFIDGKEKKVKKNIIPHIISSPYSLVLLPGEYELEIRKQERIPYREHVKIEAELITKIENIILLPQKIPEETVLEKEMLTYSVSPDNKKIIYTDKNNNIKLYNVEKKESLLIKKTEEFLTKKIYNYGTISSYVWSPNSKKVIIKISQPQSIFNYVLDINNITSSYFLHDKFSFVPFFEKIEFSAKNPYEFFGLANNILYIINTKSLTINILDTNVSNLMANNDYLYYYKKNKKEVIQFDANIYKRKTIVKNLIKANDLAIIPLNSDKNIYIKNNKKIYFLDNKNISKPIDENIDDVFIDKNKKNFYYTKEFELWFWDEIKNEKKLITRFSSKINDLKEYYNNYLFYISDESLGIIKKDGSNNIVIKDDVHIEFLKVIDQNKILVAEQKGTIKLFKILKL